MFIVSYSRVRDAICLRGGKSAIDAPSLVLSRVLGATMRSSTNASLYKIAHCNLFRSELCLPYSRAQYQTTPSSNRPQSAQNCLLGGPVRAVSRRTEQRSVQNCSHWRIKSAATRRLPDQTGRNSTSSAAIAAAPPFVSRSSFPSGACQLVPW
jgi:hypothetical protein